MKKNKIDLLKILASLWQPIAPLFNLCITSVILAMGFLRADLSAKPQKTGQGMLQIPQNVSGVINLDVVQIELIVSVKFLNFAKPHSRS